jgi:ubiquinol-cytochrome c reductase iron-sulfur subunit
MPNLTSKAGQIARCCARPRLAAASGGVSAAALAQRRFESSDASNWGATTRIPDFGKYRSKGTEQDNRTFQYVMVGTMGALTAMGAKATVVGE